MLIFSYFQIFERSSGLLQSDPDVDVRRAAAMLLTLLLQGMELQHLSVCMLAPRWGVVIGG